MGVSGRSRSGQARGILAAQLETALEDVQRQVGTLAARVATAVGIARELQATLTEGGVVVPPGRIPFREARDRWTAAYLSEALARHGGSVPATRRALRLTKSSWSRYAKRYGPGGTEARGGLRRGR